MAIRHIVTICLLFLCTRAQNDISLSSGDINNDSNSNSNIKTCQNTSSIITKSCISHKSLQGCNTCAGESNCCIDSTFDYGQCGDNIHSQCPSGEDAICSGSNCPKGLICEFMNCPEHSDNCWGSTRCADPESCSHLHDLFCYGDGNLFRNYKVCCSNKFSENQIGNFYNDSFRAIDSMTAAYNIPNTGFQYRFNTIGHSPFNEMKFGKYAISLAKIAVDSAYLTAPSPDPTSSPVPAVIEPSTCYNLPP